MKSYIYAATALIWILAGAMPALAQPVPPPVGAPCQVPPPPPPGGAPHAQPGMPPCRDPIGENLFPPDLIMMRASEIGLTDAQRASIMASMRNADQSFRSMQVQLKSAMDTMALQLHQTRVNQAQVLNQLDKVLSAERSIKRTQLGLMIQIKNVLTADQQARLRKLLPPPPMRGLTPPPTPHL